MAVFLDGPRMPPAGGRKPDCLVVLLHGYGSNGADLISLAPYWAKLLPGASFVAGIYENAPGDVPRIAMTPAWTAIAVSNGGRWLDSTAVAAGAVREYRQVVDMRSGSARTSYEWAADDSRRIAVATETFVSRADSHLAALRLQLTPRESGPLRVRFALVGRAPPKRLTKVTAPAVNSIAEMSEPCRRPAISRSVR